MFDTYSVAFSSVAEAVEEALLQRTMLSQWCANGFCLQGHSVAFHVFFLLPTSLRLESYQSIVWGGLGIPVVAAILI